MGSTFPEIDDRLREFIEAQKMFFVSTAPLSGEGLLNLSPKGLGSFRILDSTTVAYLDLPGSGIETVAHLRENGRIVVMFCAFEGPPKILRLHGKGEVIEPGEPGFDELVSQFPEKPIVRAVIRIKVGRIADSCGWGVPLMEYQNDRRDWYDFVEKLGPEKMDSAMRHMNSKSIEGMPALQFP